MISKTSVTINVDAEDFQQAVDEAVEALDKVSNTPITVEINED